MRLSPVGLNDAALGQVIEEAGAARIGGVIVAQEIQALAMLFCRMPAGKPGYRLPLEALSNGAALEPVHSVARRMLGADARPVRALLFDKRDDSNWSLGWHQDRTIAVRERREVDGFGAWTRKDGQWHVAPPIGLLEQMLTVRIHVDRVDERNAPLLIAPGSHKRGLIVESEIADIVASLGESACCAEAGDIWVYSTLILHASERAEPGRRRRVVQLDYAAVDLPGGLQWTA